LTPGKKFSKLTRFDLWQKTQVCKLTCFDTWQENRVSWLIATLNEACWNSPVIQNPILLFIIKKLQWQRCM
jgi:hypothetical protein